MCCIVSYTASAAPGEPPGELRYRLIGVSLDSGGEVQELRDEHVRDAVVDLGAEVDDALREQAAVDVDRALGVAALLDDVGDRVGAHAGTRNPVIGAGGAAVQLVGAVARRPGR